MYVGACVGWRAVCWKRECVCGWEIWKKSKLEGERLVEKRGKKGRVKRREI